MVCEECGMRNTSRKCNLCGHRSKRSVVMTSESIDNCTPVLRRSELDTDLSKSMKNANMPKLSDLTGGNSVKKTKNKVNFWLRAIIGIVMITNILPILLEVVLFNDSEWYETESTYYEENWIDIDITGVLESTFISEWFGTDIPELILSDSYTEFELSLFDEQYQTDAKITCYDGKWYNITVYLYDISCEDLNEYLLELFTNYGGDSLVYDKEYDCVSLEIDNDVSISAYLSEQYDSNDKYFSSIYITNANYYDY